MRGGRAETVDLALESVDAGEKTGDQTGVDDDGLEKTRTGVGGEERAVRRRAAVRRDLTHTTNSGQFTRQKTAEERSVGRVRQ